MYLTYLLESQIHANQNTILECCSSETRSDCKDLCTSFCCVHREACACRDLDKGSGFETKGPQQTHEWTQESGWLHHQVNTLWDISLLPPSQLESPRFQDVALFTEKQFVRGLPSRLPALILLLPLTSAYWGPCCLSVFLKLLIEMFFCFFAQNNLGPVSLPLCNAFGFREDLVSSFLSQSPRKQAGHTGWISHDGSQSFPQELSFGGLSAKICNLKVWSILIGNTEQFVKLNTFLSLEETEILNKSYLGSVAWPLLGPLFTWGQKKK